MPSPPKSAPYPIYASRGQGVLTKPWRRRPVRADARPDFLGPSGLGFWLWVCR